MMRRLLAPFAPLLDYWRAAEQHSLFTHAAASAFFLFLSLPPALLSLVALIGMIPIEQWTEGTTESLLEGLRSFVEWYAPAETAQAVSTALELRMAPLLAGLQDLTTVALVQRIQELFDRTMPPDLARAVGAITANILGNPKPSLVTASFLVILWSSSGATRAAMRALGTIYEVRRRSWFVRNALALGLTVGLLLMWTLIIAILPVSNALAAGLVNYLGLDAGVMIGWSAFNWCIGGLLLFATVLSLNRLGPDVSLRLRAVLPGSLLTLVLWITLSWGLGAWMERSWHKYNATYGTLAGVIVLLLWSYMISLGLLLGAELNTAILRWKARAWNAGLEFDLEAATRAAVEREAVEDLVESAVSALGGRVLNVGRRTSRGSG